MEGYLDYRWLPGTIRRQDPKGLIAAHFRRLGLTTSYRHETHPDDSLFEDVKGFEDVIIRIQLKHILEDKIATLGQDPEIDQLEWRRQCFETQTNKKTKRTDKGDQERGEDSGKQQEQGNLDNPSSE